VLVDRISNACVNQALTRPFHDTNQSSDPNSLKPSSSPYSQVPLAWNESTLYLQTQPELKNQELISRLFLEVVIADLKSKRRLGPLLKPIATTIWHTTGQPNGSIFPEPESDASTYHTYSARTADPKPDPNAPPELYVEFAFKNTTDLNAGSKFS
jgi:hypothetical protein